MKILVAGAGGFIGGHLTNDLIKKNHTVVAVDRKPFKEWYQINDKSNKKGIFWSLYRKKMPPKNKNV